MVISKHNCEGIRWNIDTCLCMLLTTYTHNECTILFIEMECTQGIKYISSKSTVTKCYKITKIYGTLTAHTHISGYMWSIYDTTTGSTYTPSYNVVVTCYAGRSAHMKKITRTEGNKNS